MTRRNTLLEPLDRAARHRQLAAASFLLTCGSVFFVRLFRWEQAGWWSQEAMWNAWWFTGVLMAILLCHELGHFAVARLHGFRISPPWFIPAPILIGTLGAVIHLEERPRTRAGLLEMGAAGPLAGVIVVVLVMFAHAGWGTPELGGSQLPSPLLWTGLSLLIRGEVVPLNTADPVAFAAWLGCLLTTLNLLPFGQLDGGHMVAALWPRRAVAIAWLTTACLLVGGIWAPGLAIWAAVLHLLGTRHPVTARKDDGFDSSRPYGIAVVTVVVWFLVAVPPG